MKSEKNQVWWGCVCTNASNFWVTGQSTPDSFPFEYRSPWCYNYFFLKKLKEAFLWIKWPSPRLTSQGWWVHKGIALDTPLGHNRNQGKDAHGQRRCDLALLERQCAVAFPRLPPSTHILPHTPRLQGLRRNPCHLESQSVLLGRAKGKFGIRIPKCEIKKTWIKKLSTFSKNWSLVNS